MKKKQPSEILMPALPRHLKIKKESRIKIEKELERRIFLIYTFSKRIMRDALSGVSKKLKKEMLLYFKIFFLFNKGSSLKLSWVTTEVHCWIFQEKDFGQKPESINWKFPARAFWRSPKKPWRTTEKERIELNGKERKNNLFR